jgi:amino acid adenylation domain-containing protein
MFMMYLQQIPDKFNASSKLFLHSARPQSSALPFTDLKLKNEDVVSLFLATVNNNANKIALRDDNQDLSYAQLLAAAKNIAIQLSNKGVNEGGSVVLMMPKGVEAIVCLWGILLCGASYIPLSKDTSISKLKIIVKQTQAQLLVCDEIVSGVSSQLTVKGINFEKNKFVPASINIKNYASQIYTSGSTGEPKRVSISHANLSHSLASRLQYYGQNDLCYGLVSPFHFDSSMAGIFWTAATGGCLVLINERSLKDPQLLLNDLSRHKVSTLLVLPSVYRAILDLDLLQLETHLNRLIVAGEAASQALFLLHDKHLPNVSFINEYGPTEATIWCSAKRFLKTTELQESEPYLSIGQSIPGVKLEVLDKQLRTVPKGVVGELYISGENVSNTAKPHQAYASGDLVCVNDQDELFFRGRIDDQIKIRGHRVSPAEIEASLSQYPSISACAVVALKHEPNHSVEAINNALQALPLSDACLLLDSVEKDFA